MKKFWTFLAIVWVGIILLGVSRSVNAATWECLPGIRPTTEFPTEPLPPDEPYEAMRLWGKGSYWYCYDNNTGKYKGYYSIAVFNDLFTMVGGLTALDNLLHEIQDAFRTAATPQEKRAYVESTYAQYQSPKWSCSDPNTIEPYRSYCADINNVSFVHKPIDQVITPPPVSQWVVSPTSICAAIDKINGVCVRRPSYSWNGSVRGSQIGTATIGGPCNVNIGANGFYGVNNKTDEVSACQKK